MDNIRRYRANLQDELNGAELYRAVAAAERDPNRRDVFLQLAAAESQHAQFWRDKLAEAGVREGKFSPALRTRLLGALARYFGPRFVLPTVAAAEASDRDKYRGQPDALPISADEHGHAAVVERHVSGSAWPGEIPYRRICNRGPRRARRRAGYGIRGTRHVLPSGRFLPRPGRIEIHVLPPLGPLEDAGPAATAALRENARPRILRALDEPDLR